MVPLPPKLNRPGEVVPGTWRVTHHRIQREDHVPDIGQILGIWPCHDDLLFGKVMESHGKSESPGPKQLDLLFPDLSCATGIARWTTLQRQSGFHPTGCPGWNGMKRSMDGYAMGEGICSTSKFHVGHGGLSQTSEHDWKSKALENSGIFRKYLFILVPWFPIEISNC